ncbi:tetratricopeptide repeat protein [Thiohalorhabdus methylotrophus]|uniref:Tetratricopeptide repeat protein n=1 Tax=Thiohalorhabdus methylotrophus TaxID=3242694 RepID=A0ABV4TRS2_9GAMM
MHTPVTVRSRNRRETAAGMARGALMALLLAAGVPMLAGCSDPDFRDGLQAYQTGDYARAAHVWRRLAESGDRLAQHHLANLYRAGLGVERDPGRALHWAREAANGGHPEAYAHVAFLYQAGLGGRPRLREAYQWYRLAARNLPAGAKRREAIRNRDRLAERLTPAERRAAARWLARYGGE